MRGIFGKLFMMMGIGMLALGARMTSAVAHDRYHRHGHYQPRAYYVPPPPVYYAPPPGVYYAPPPPPVYYAPPPVYYAPPRAYYAPAPSGYATFNFRF
jgi:hypothetical protein